MKLEGSVPFVVLLVACSSEPGAEVATSAGSTSTQGASTTSALPPDSNMPLEGNPTASTGASATVNGSNTALVTSTSGIGGNTSSNGVGTLGTATGTTGVQTQTAATGTLSTSASAASTTGAGGATATASTSGVGGAATNSTTQAATTQAVTTQGTTTLGTSTTGTVPEGQCVVQPLTDAFRQNYDNLDPFYKKYADANGLPVISSDAPADLALTRACELVIDMVSIRPDVLAALIDNHIRFAIIGESELTNDIPEYSYMDDSINERARGLGGTPAASCAEESILCNTDLDRWRGEGICVHEFAHTIASGGLFPADSTFEDRLQDAYQNAQSTGLFANTYAMENFQEYWAEGVQDWYFTNLEADPPNGIHNFVDRREELQAYDPTLYALIAEFLPAAPQFVDCYSDE